MTRPRGLFVSFEAGEGAGKSTQIRLLFDALTARGVDAVLTREPGGSPGAEEIRKLLVTGEPDRWDGVTEMLLFSAARRDHLRRTVRPALEAGRWVLCDRFADSTMAYQGYARGLGQAICTTLYGVAAGDLEPDITLILDLPVEEGLARTRGRSGAEDRFERIGLDFHLRLRDAFLDIARRNPHRCVVLDASGTPEEVHARVLAAVLARAEEGR